MLASQRVPWETVFFSRKNNLGMVAFSTSGCWLHLPDLQNGTADKVFSVILPMLTPVVNCQWFRGFVSSSSIPGWDDVMYVPWRVHVWYANKTGIFVDGKCYHNVSIYGIHTDPMGIRLCPIIFPMDTMIFVDEISWKASGYPECSCVN